MIFIAKKVDLPKLVSMNINELRIGNLLQHKHDGSIIEAVVEPYLAPKFWESIEGTYEGIPLTEKWLFKLGLTRKDEEHFYLKKDDHQILIDVKGFDVWFDFREEGYYCSIRENLKYVHKLQNFYFELNDEELSLQ